MELTNTDQVLQRTAFELGENRLQCGGETLAALFLVHGAGSMTWFSLRMGRVLDAELKTDDSSFDHQHPD